MNRLNGITVEQHAPDVVVDDDDMFVFSPSSVTPRPLREIVIDGYLRRGETANIIAPPKRGKSWLVLGLAFAVAEGRKWLGNQCRQGRVLLVDAELHRETIEYRMQTVAEAVEAENGITVLKLRGKNRDLAALAMRLDRIKPGTYDLLVLDALYRFLPQGTSENDNAAMMALYNQIDQIAERLDCAVVIIHHTSKGSQADKAVTDVGSGAGSISRAADTHITIRDHNEPDYQVLEAVTRSFPAPDPKTVYFKFPLWHESDLEPQAKGGRVPQSKINDQETRERILKLLKQASGSITFTKLRERTGFGFQRIARGVAMLEESGEAKRTKVKAKKGGKPADAVRLAKMASSV
ncbi:MAG: AAA family ATPase [Planctomycetaceae bacterium]|nr:AAA family ATPase [Planctomycetaceae bacterium]